MRSADVSRHEAEIAIHLSRPEVLDVKLVRLGRMHLMFFAGQKYIESYGAPKSADELVKHRFVMPTDAQTAAQWTFRKPVSRSFPTRAAGDENQRQQRQRLGPSPMAPGIGVLPTSAGGREVK
jgi:hypothetical protein